MPRPLRIQFAGAVYHVMARGNQGRPIYKDDKDRVRFLETLAEACEKTGWQVHAYVLMNNHYHLLLTTPEPNLSSGMKWLQSAYTQRYNGRHKVFGHLFQGRYKALIMDPADSNYVQFVSTYIHLNPVRSGLIRPGREKLKRYRWSSYPHYLARKCPPWLSRASVLESLGLNEQKRSGYETYLEGRVLELANKAATRGAARAMAGAAPRLVFGRGDIPGQIETPHRKSRVGPPAPIPQRAGAPGARYRHG